MYSTFVPQFNYCTQRWRNQKEERWTLTETIWSEYSLFLVILLLLLCKSTGRFNKNVQMLYLLTLYLKILLYIALQEMIWCFGKCVRVLGKLWENTFITVVWGPHRKFLECNLFVLHINTAPHFKYTQWVIGFLCLLVYTKYIMFYMSNIERARPFPSFFHGQCKYSCFYTSPKTDIGP